jgi:hypothetical protein
MGLWLISNLTHALTGAVAVAAPRTQLVLLVAGETGRRGILRKLLPLRGECIDSKLGSTLRLICDLSWLLLIREHNIKLFTSDMP